MGSSFPDEVYYFHPIAFIEHLRKITNCYTLKQAKELAVKGTAFFEGAWDKVGNKFNYGVLASNFDAAGLSMGLLQWNIKSRNFFTKLNEMYEKNSDKFKECYESGNPDRFKTYFDKDDWDSVKYKKIWEFDIFTDFIDDTRDSNLNYQFLWAKLLHVPEKIKVTDSNDKYRGWINKQGVTHASALRSEILEFFKSLGNWHEFQKIQYNHASEGQYMKKAISEIKWLREITKTKFPKLMEFVEIRTFVAMFDLCVQHGSLYRKIASKNIDVKKSIESNIASKNYANQHDFMEMVVKERAKGGSTAWQNNSASRRMGFLNAQKSTVSDLGGDSYTVSNVNYKVLEDNRIIIDFYD
ncbi:hypothetical protein KKA14_10200 [bacterium]|nr:hypothetical protein [bacterium]